MRLNKRDLKPVAKETEPPKIIEVQKPDDGKLLGKMEQLHEEIARNENKIDTLINEKKSLPVPANTRQFEKKQEELNERLVEKFQQLLTLSQSDVKSIKVIRDSFGRMSELQLVRGEGN